MKLDHCKVGENFDENLGLDKAIRFNSADCPPLCICTENLGFSQIKNPTKSIDLSN